MRIRHLVYVTVFSALSSGAIAQAADSLKDYSPPHVDEGLNPAQRVRVEALSAAMRFFAENQIEVDDNVLVVFRQGRLIRVELSPPDRNYKDGHASVLYDPLSGKIVQTAIEG